MVLSCHRNAWVAPDAVVLLPTTWPARFSPVGLLKSPPRVPRSERTLSRQTNPWVAPEAVKLHPATCPPSLMDCAQLPEPPRVPRSTRTLSCQRNAWTIWPGTPLHPTTCSEALTAVASPAELGATGRVGSRTTSYSPVAVSAALRVAARAVGLPSRQPHRTGSSNAR